MKIRTRLSPTPRAAAILALAAPLALASIPLALIAVAALVAVAIVDAAATKDPVRVQREPPTLVSRGRPLPLRISARRSGGRTVTVRQPIPPDVDISPPEGSGSLEATLVARRRGRHVLPPPGRRREGPLGLVARYDSEGEPLELKVYPDVMGAQRIVSAIRTQQFSAGGRHTRPQFGLGTEFESIREYGPDDDFRQINWRATARTGRPMSNQYRVEHDRDVVCLLDAGRLMQAPLGDRTRLDVAVDAVTAVASVAEEVEDRCGVIAFDSSLRRVVRPHRRSMRAVLEAVYDLEPTSADTDYELAFRQIAGDKRSLVILLTDLIDEWACATLIEATPVIGRRHAVAIASAADEDIGRVVRSAPRSAADAYRVAAAADVLERRRSLRARLAGVGAEVVEAPADDLSAACVGAYLRAKNRARL